ncbi:MAG TPA: amidohydrolase family protein [Longimicrobiales bacterium]|nr:amidohydrolase family protein [Longimicrobiales bacterium]
MNAMNGIIRSAVGALAVLAAAFAFAAPAGAQTYAIRGGTVHTLTGRTFVGTVVVRDGRIVDVGPDVQPPEGAEIVDATGKHVYPGMFDAVSGLGLTEVGAVDVTNDSEEQGDFKPHLQTAAAIHPATEHIPVTRANGVTHTMAAPGGGIIAGQASLVGLDGWTVEEMSIEPGAAMVINFPSLTPRRGYGASGASRPWKEVEKAWREQVARLDAWMDAARQHSRAAAAGAAEPSLELAALAKVVSREMPVLLEANGERDIRNAVEWAERQNIRYVITGGSQGWKIASWLAGKRVPMILGPSQVMPSGSDPSYDEAYANAGKLHAAGVKIAFATFNSSDSRTLPYEAAMAVPFGLPREAALEAVMKNGAEMLGLGDRMGTIELGKIANLIVTDGDPLEIQTQVLDLFILGRQVSTDNKHKALYEKHRARPKEKVIS